jgi:TolB-like protein
MRSRTLLLASAIAVVLLLKGSAAFAARQLVALFPLQNLADNTIAPEVATSLGQALKEKLQDRLDVQAVSAAEGPQAPSRMRRKARDIGATYILTGAVSRIGHTVTLDLTLAATEDPGKGRTVVVTGVEDRATGAGGLPPVYARMATEAASRLKYLFFGDEVIGEGASRRKIPKLSGIVSRSRSIPGNIVSIAWMDTDRDGKVEVVAAYEDGIAVYRLEGDDLEEKARIAEAGEGLVHVDAADMNRNGIAEIIAVRYAAGKAVSDVWEFDGKQYNKTARDIPYFLRTVDLGGEGVVLLAQESDPVTIFKGPVFRIAMNRYGAGERKDMETPLPLPEGTWIYSFTTLKKGGAVRYATLGDRDRLILLDEKGKKLWEGIDAVSGTETSLDAALLPFGIAPLSDLPKRLYLPNRLLGIDLAEDKNDVLVVLNNLVTAGGFFESIRVFSNSEALCFAQEGDSLKLAWRTAQTGASARDAFLDFSPKTRTLRIGIAARDTGKLLGKFGEWRVFWLK